MNNKNNKKARSTNNDTPKLTMSANNRVARWIVYGIVLALVLGMGLSFLGAAIPLDSATTF